MKYQPSIHYWTLWNERMNALFSLKNIQQLFKFSCIDLHAWYITKVIYLSNMQEMKDSISFLPVVIYFNYSFIYFLLDKDSLMKTFTKSLATCKSLCKWAQTQYVTAPWSCITDGAMFCSMPLLIISINMNNVHFPKYFQQAGTWDGTSVFESDIADRSAIFSNFYLSYFSSE